MTQVDEAEAHRLIVGAVDASLGPGNPVILLGSRATGDADAESDYDVFVVLPASRVVTAARRLARASSSLASELGAEVSIKPLPRFRLHRPGKTLLIWKLHREGRLLSGPDVLESRNGGPPDMSAQARSSYAMSGLQFLIADLDPPELDAMSVRPELQRQIRKAALHAVQIRLLRDGNYASRLDEALRLVGPELAAALGEVRSGSLPPRLWFTARDLLMSEVEIPRPGVVRSALQNAQYCALSMLRGRGPRPVLRASAPRERVWQATTLLTAAVREHGLLDARDTADAVRALSPISDRRPLDWRGARDLLLAEWPNADPLTGI